MSDDEQERKLPRLHINIEEKSIDAKKLHPENLVEDLVDGQLVIGDQVVTVDDNDIARLILQPNLISNGHYSNVYRFEKNGIKMAVKEIKLHKTKKLSDDDDNPFKYLGREVTIMRNMKEHENLNVVWYYGALTHGVEYFYIFMEPLDITAFSLYKYVHEKTATFPENVLTQIAISILKGLIFLKDVQHTMHRDVKPENILLDCKGRIKLCDFGLAIIAERSVARTNSIGTECYVPPERLTSTLTEYDSRTDVWSYGVSMLEIGIGHHPFIDPNPKPSTFIALTAITKKDPPFGLINNTYSADFITFLTACLQKDVANRPRYTRKCLRDEVIITVTPLIEMDFYTANSQKTDDHRICVAELVTEAVAAQSGV